MAFQKEAAARGGFWRASLPALFGDTVTLTGITALAGGANSASTPQLPQSNYIVIGTCATSADSVRMPVGETGDECWIYNGGAAPCAVFPQTGSAFLAGAADAKFTITNAKLAHFKCISVTPAGVALWAAGMFA